MIREITDPAERESVLLRAQFLIGADEQHLSPVWLSRPDIFCVAQENDNHSIHREEAALSGAFSYFPGARWVLVEVSDNDVSDPVELSNPVESRFDSDPELLPGHWDMLSFLLFSLDQDAAIPFAQVKLPTRS